MLRVSPIHNLPTGYSVFRDEKTVVENIEECKRVCRLHRVWEEFYIHPLKISRGNKMLEWSESLKKGIFDEVSIRRLSGYKELEGSDQEKTALEELDNEVYAFHETEMELLNLEKKLIALQFDLFEKPSEENIKILFQIIDRLQELLPIHDQYLKRRISAWKEYQDLLERKYKVSVIIKFNIEDIGFAAFVDLMKYVLTNNIVPEGIITGVCWDLTKSVAKAKIAESMLNLLVHYEGLESLQSQARSLMIIQNNLQHYTQIWKTEISPEMIRLPAVV